MAFQFVSSMVFSAGHAATAMRRRHLVRLLCLASSAGICSIPIAARAVITFGGTGNNYTPAPGDPKVSSVNNYEGFINGSFTGTMVSSNCVISAAHTFGNVVQQFTFNDANTLGVAQTFNTQIAASLDDLELASLVPGQTDTLGQPAVFPASQQAPIYTGNSEVGASIVDVGRGVSRAGATTGGWLTDGNQGPFSWGTNTISAIRSDTSLATSGQLGGDYLQYAFNNNPTDPNECINTTFDSGGGLFINNNGTYQLAGINTLVDSAYNSPSSSDLANAVLYDTFGYYQQDAGGLFMQATTHTPESSYATRVSSKTNFINLVAGNISKANAASAPINIDSNGQMNVYQNLTTGAITGGGTLQVGSNAVTATMQIAPNSGASELSALYLFNGNGHNSTLDITDNHIIIDWGSNPMLEAELIGYLQSGYNGGAWNGPGIVSSIAAAGGGLYGVGFAEYADSSVPGLTHGQAEIAYSLYGDCNLDHVVNAVDFGIVAANFNKSVKGGWGTADFNYDGVVNGVDFGMLVQNMNKGTSGADAIEMATVDSFAAANGLMQDVPEPGSTAVLACCTTALTMRLRRRNGAKSGAAGHRFTKLYTPC
jgi:hypothetical protein